MRYYVEHEELESAAGVLQADAGYTDAAALDLAGVSKIPAPAAGVGVGAALAGLESGWTEVLPRLSKEMIGLAARTRASATIYVEVEEPIAGGFRAFAE